MMIGTREKKEKNQLTKKVMLLLGLSVREYFFERKNMHVRVHGCAHKSVRVEQCQYTFCIH